MLPSKALDLPSNFGHFLQMIPLTQSVVLGDAKPSLQGCFGGTFAFGKVSLGIELAKPLQKKILACLCCTVRD